MVDASLKPLLRQAEPLTEFAWKFRCLREPEEPSREPTEEALALLGIQEEVFVVISIGLTL